MSGTFRIAIRCEQNKTETSVTTSGLPSPPICIFIAQYLVEVSLRLSHHTCISFGVKHTEHQHTFECIAFEMENFKKFHFPVLLLRRSISKEDLKRFSSVMLGAHGSSSSSNSRLPSNTPFVLCIYMEHFPFWRV